MQRTLSIIGSSLFVSALLIAQTAAAASLPSKATLTCHFPAAEVVNRVKPGQKNVSDGVIRITDDVQEFTICPDCKWANSGAKWKVSDKQFHIATPGGVEVSIARNDGSAVYAITAKPDESYLGGRVESRGQCQIAAPAAATPASTAKPKP